MKKKVLFVCIHNSGRSQMAEELLKKYDKDNFEVKSAGFEPEEVNPLVIKLLQEEESVDLSNKGTNSVFELFQQSQTFNYVITVCDEGNAQKCPLFPGVTKRIHMSFEDPKSFTGSDEEKLEKIKNVKEKIKKEVLEFAKLVKSGKLQDNVPNNWKIS